MDVEQAPKGPASQPVAGERPAPSKFKVIGHFVLAMKRFQNALNPTYSYGKRPSDSDVVPLGTAAFVPIGSMRAQTGQPVGSSSMRQNSGRTMSDGRLSGSRPDEAGKQYGHKGGLLFKPLPSIKAET